MRLPLLSYSCCALFLGAGLAVVRGPAAEPQRRPPMRVLLLPVTDATPEGGNMLGARSAVIRHRWQFEFLSRGFAVGGEQLAVQAGPRVTWAAPAPKSAEMLDELARRAGVDWVVNTVVESAAAEPGHGTGFEVETRLHLQVRDAAAQRWLHNGPYTAKVADTGTPVMVFFRSLDAAARGSIAAVLAGHPPQTALAGEDSLTDYLAGATGLVTAATLPAAMPASPDKAAP